jgi:TusA-related sulfurtransferase
MFSRLLGYAFSGGLFNKATPTGATCNERHQPSNSSVIPKCSVACYRSISMKPEGPEDHVRVDARGLACPLPILALARALREQPDGGLVELWATDPAAEADVQAFCAATGNLLETLERVADILRARVRKQERNG